MNTILFQSPTFYQSSKSYELLPFRFTRIPQIPREVLVTTDAGEYCFLKAAEFQLYISKRLPRESDVYLELRAKKFLADGAFPKELAIRLASAQIRSRKSFLRTGPRLHIVVVTLRCDHSCPYCQVSRQTADKARYDLADAHALSVVDRIFESRSSHLTVEFQGGEPLLAFDRVRALIELIEHRNQVERREVSFVVATTLNLASREMLIFFRDHNVKLSTSLDGPEWLHNENRPNRTKDSYRRTIEGIARAREVVGDGNVAALVTLTRKSLSHARAIVDTYVELGFGSIFLRPLSPFGFATKSANHIGYSVDDYLSFYKEALSYIIELNRSGVALEEAYATLLLGHILTPFSSGYVDLRSPCGAALDTLVYNYDGAVYASDEGRMLAEMGNTEFALGTVDQPYATLFRSSAMEQVLAGAVAESLPGCSDCAYVPYCGADPVFAVATQGDPIGHRPTSAFCRRQTALFQLLFGLLRRRDPEVMRVFLAWLSRRSVREVAMVGYTH